MSFLFIAFFDGFESAPADSRGGAPSPQAHTPTATAPVSSSLRADRSSVGEQDVDRSAARAGHAGQTNVALTGQVETQAKAEIIDGNASLAAREGEKPLHSNSSSALTSSRATGKPDGRVGRPSPSGPILKPLSKADQIRLLRPNCLNVEVCAGSGKQHCHACTTAMATGEAA